MLLAGPASAQYQVTQGAFVSGSGTMGGDHTVWSSAGQVLVGVSLGSSEVRSGFWYLADVASTVDVAITSFFAEYDGRSVVLSWTVGSEVSLSGFNVYRSEGRGGAYTRLNGEVIAAAVTCSYADDTALPGESYLYRFGWIDGSGEHLSMELSVVTPSMPTTLFQNFPNPFNPSTSIGYYLSADTDVTLDIFDVSGKHIASLVRERQAKGYHTAAWQGTDDVGNTAGSGVYFCLLRAGKEVSSRKIVMLR